MIVDIWLWLQQAFAVLVDYFETFLSAVRFLLGLPLYTVTLAGYMPVFLSLSLTFAVSIALFKIFTGR